MWLKTLCGFIMPSKCGFLDLCLEVASWHSKILTADVNKAVPVP
jgi:hypothetical protein